jgi:DNA-binding transcriptional regulator YiaG
MDDYTMEVWKDVKGYEGIYQVSDKGRIKSLERLIYIPSKKTNRLIKERIMKLKTNRWGYKTVNFNKNKKSKTFQVHVVVANHFLKKEIAKNYVNHEDGNKLNNSAKNLKYVTTKENMEHAIENGLIINRHKRVKKEDAKAIREKYNNNKGITQKELAEEYDTSIRTISNIVNWKCHKNAL